MKTLLFVFFLTQSAMSCKPKSSDSTVQHVWGETTRQYEGFEYSKCKDEASTKFPKSVEYIAAIGHFIMRSNPDTFKPGTELDPENFCFRVADSDVANAQASSSSREITFTTQRLRQTDSDADVAVTMAHELAHISLQHSKVAHPDYTPTGEYLEIKKQFDALSQAVSSEDLDKIGEPLKEFVEQKPDFDTVTQPIINELSAMYGLSDEFSRANAHDGSGKGPEARFIELFPTELQGHARNYVEAIKRLFIRLKDQKSRHEKLIGRLKKEMAKDPNISDDAYNWQEREADEIGFEFYVRSGFAPENVIDYRTELAYQSIMNETSQPMTPAQCLVIGITAKSNEDLARIIDDKVDRGRSSHPLGCWRLLHLVYESRIHSDDYQAKPYNGSIENFSPKRSGALDEIGGGSSYGATNVYYEPSRVESVSSGASAQPSGYYNGGPVEVYQQGTVDGGGDDVGGYSK